MKNRLTHTLLGIVAFLVLVLMPARAEDEGGAPKRGRH